MADSETRVKAVFIGNSITEEWGGKHAHFFQSNNYVAKGISGQVTAQFVTRFQEDVVNLNPKMVVINGGINDIAENVLPYNSNDTFRNIKEMADMAEAAGIKVILTSVLPANNFPWNENITDVASKITHLNDSIRAYASSKGYLYVDYYSQMVDEQQGMIAEYTYDGVHVTDSGYAIMKTMIKEAIDKNLVE